MHRAASAVVAIIVLLGRPVHAQQIPVSVASAESEGARFPRDSAPAVVPELFGALPFGGSSERRCVRSVSDDSLPGGSLRSGDLIMRTRFAPGPHGSGLRADRASKIVWFPLHAPQRGVVRGYRLLIRAEHIGDHADTLRTIIGGVTGGGFPSLVQFPRPGEWLVVATSGKDWGCFLLEVADPAKLAQSYR